MDPQHGMTLAQLEALLDQGQATETERAEIIDTFVRAREREQYYQTRKAKRKFSAAAVREKGRAHA